MSSPAAEDLQAGAGLVGPATDLNKWRLYCEKGRQRWVYEEGEGPRREQNFIERHSLGLDTVSCS